MFVLILGLYKAVLGYCKIAKNGDYYHKKKEINKMPGNKAMTVVARQLLRKIYGWYKSGKSFDEERFFTCKGEYQKAKMAAS